MFICMGWISKNWEKLLFRLIGAVVLVFAGRFLYQSQMSAFATSFGIAFFCFFYANLARFKKFKGLGFEAELWADKQKEAEDLIGRLKEVYEIYSNEILISKAKEGRWGSSENRWTSVWELYDLIDTRHNKLGQNLNLSKAKKTLDQYFIFDIIHPLYDEIQKTVSEGHAMASSTISREFGSPIKDAEAYGQRIRQLQNIKKDFGQPFTLAKEGKLASELLSWFDLQKSEIKDAFSVTIDMDTDARKRLKQLALLEILDSVPVTQELIDQASPA